jgi:L-asparaginase II
MNSPYSPLFELTRGGVVESLHYGAIAVVDAGGRLVASHGDPQAITYLRSSAKPFQALPFIEAGGQRRYGLAPEEIALICASHSGTDEHVAAVLNLQAKVGVSEADLLCGAHMPFHQPTVQAMRQRGEAATPNRHNCSGKHTGMMAYAGLLGLSIPKTAEGIAYIDPAHPVQQEILKTMAAMARLDPQDIQLGTDGCSVPTFALPLYSAALAFARLCDPQAGQVDPPRRAEACRTIVAAMTAHPLMVGGPEAFDTRLMQASGGRILCKGGAEGYLTLGLLPEALDAGSPALGIAIKVSDGDLGSHSRSAGDPLGRARPAVALEALRQLGAVGQAELEALSDFGPTFTVHNWRKLVVGEGRPSFRLDRGK